MYIKKLTIYESHPTDKKIREVTFRAGVNFIVDSFKKPGQKGNGIGKTTVLRVIDVCLGAKGKKYLYYDEEHSITNIVLKNYINNSKVYAELTLCDDLNKSSDGGLFVLRVDLYERGHRYINSEPYNEEGFKAFLNEIIFENQFNHPKFRELIGMFVRIKLKDDNNRFLKYLDNFSSNDEYESIYSYLFRLSAQDVSQAILESKRKIASLTTSLTQLFSMNGIKSINAIEQKVIEVEKDIKVVRTKINKLIDANELKKNEEDVSHVREQYSRITNEIDIYSFKLSRVIEVLADAEEQSSHQVDTSVLRNIYDETKNNFDGLVRSFDELVAFNKQLITNKISYFQSQRTKLEERINQLNVEKNDLFKKYKDVVLLIKDSDVNGYVTLQAELEEKTKSLGRLEKVIENYSDLTLQKKEAEDQLKTLQDIPTVDPKENLSIFNDYFTTYSRAINQEPYLLYRTEKGFPLALENIESGFSTGTKKSAIAAFDLAYQSYATDKKIPHPHFIVHDVIETMDEVGLNNIIKITKQIGCQYIVAVLQDKIKGNPNVNEADIRLELSKDNKFFKV